MWLLRVLELPWLLGPTTPGRRCHDHSYVWEGCLPHHCGSAQPLHFYTPSSILHPLSWVCLPLSHVLPFAISWTIAHQAPLSMEFSRQEYRSGLPCLLQGIFLTQGSNPGLPHCRKILYHLIHQGSPSRCVFHSSSLLGGGFPDGTSGKEPACQGRRCKR